MARQEVRKMEVLAIQDSSTGFDTLLAKSCRIYQEINRIYDYLQKNMLKASTIQMSASHEELECLMREARTVDDLLKDLISPQTSLPETTKELLNARRELIAALHRKNRKIAQNATNVQSHIRYELNKFGKNRTALKGYKPAMSVKKCLINTTS